jgi:hypothetical protein
MNFDPHQFLLETTFNVLSAFLEHVIRIKYPIRWLFFAFRKHFLRTASQSVKYVRVRAGRKFAETAPSPSFLLHQGINCGANQEASTFLYLYNIYLSISNVTQRNLT